MWNETMFLFHRNIRAEMEASLGGCWADPLRPEAVPGHLAGGAQRSPKQPGQMPAGVAGVIMAR